jgi:hypothetical protein
LARSARFFFGVFRSLLFQVYGEYGSLRSLLFRRLSLAPLASFSGVWCSWLAPLASFSVCFARSARFFFRCMVSMARSARLFFGVFRSLRSLLFQVYGVVGSLRSLLFRCVSLAPLASFSGVWYVSLASFSGVWCNWLAPLACFSACFARSARFFCRCMV